MRVDLHSFDLVVAEATPAGIAMAVRAAREGLRVLLATRGHHLGGILASGLGVSAAAHYFGARGFFPGYDARLTQPLDRGTARVWAAVISGAASGDLRAIARAVRIAEQRHPDPIDHQSLGESGWPDEQLPALTRGTVLEYLWVRQQLANA